MRIADLFNKTFIFYCFSGFVKRNDILGVQSFSSEKRLQQQEVLTEIPEFLHNTVTLRQPVPSLSAHRTSWISIQIQPNLIKVRFRLDFQALFQGEGLKGASSGPLDDQKAVRATRLSVKSLWKPPPAPHAPYGQRSTFNSA